MGRTRARARLLLLVTDLFLGGTPTVVRELALRLHREGVAVEVACLAIWGPVADQIQAGGVSVTALGARGRLDVGVFQRLVKLIREREITTVFSFLVHANVASAWAQWRLPHLRLVQSIQTTQPRPRWHWQAQCLAQRAAQWVVVPSESVAEKARQWARVPQAKIRIVPNAIDAEVFSQVVSPSLDQGPMEIGFVGRLDPIKRVLDLVDAVEMLGVTARLHIFGTGEQEQAIRNRIEQGGLQERIMLHGAVERPEQAMGQIAALVLPSEAEGFGLVLIEAMAAGVPVVATDVPGIRDVVRHEGNGLLVPVRSPAALARAIERLRREPLLRMRLVQQGGADVRCKYSWNKVLMEYRQILNL